jgi:hypothetical protein
MTTGLALAEKIGPDDALRACQVLGLSTRWLRRSHAFRMFDSGYSVQRVHVETHIPKRSCYRYFIEWRAMNRSV